MDEKPLKTYLDKAEYLMVLIKDSAVKSHVMKHKGVHIPSINVSKMINQGMLQKQSPLSPPLSSKNHVAILKQLINSPILSSEDESDKACPKACKVIKAAKSTSRVSKQQNLYLLHIAKIYYANKSSSKSVTGWKVPSLVRVTNQVRHVLRAPLTAPGKAFFKDHKVTSSLKKGSKKEENSGIEKADLALEVEYSHRRNYRTSRPLHT